MRAFWFVFALTAIALVGGCGKEIENLRNGARPVIFPTPAPTPSSICAPSLSTEVCKNMFYGSMCRTVINQYGLCRKNANNNGCDCVAQ